MCNGTHFPNFNLVFRALVTTATGSEDKTASFSVLSPGTDMVLEVVRIAVNE